MGNILVSREKKAKQQIRQDIKRINKRLYKIKRKKTFYLIDFLGREPKQDAFLKDLGLN